MTLNHWHEFLTLIEKREGLDAQLALKIASLHSDIEADRVSPRIGDDILGLIMGHKTESSSLMGMTRSNLGRLQALVHSKKKGKM